MKPSPTPHGENDTPRTDDFYRRWDHQDLSEIVEHGRQLERELNSVRRLLGDSMKRIRELETATKTKLTKREKDAVREAVVMRLAGEMEDVDIDALERAQEKL